jgi:hypothetical protein
MRVANQLDRQRFQDARCAAQLLAEIARDTRARAAEMRAHSRKLRERLRRERKPQREA